VDEAGQIETFQEWLRVRFAGDIPGLRQYVLDLGDGEATESVVITSNQFAGDGASGQLVLEPLGKLRAALQVLRELDPDSATSPPSSGRIVDFSQRRVET
jgi:hypothetical protein